MASDESVSWGNHKIEWSNDLLLHMEQEDGDHREMFVLMNRIFSAAQIGADMVTQAVADLCLFTREHFLREQHGMERAGYPDREAHRYDHEYLIFQLDVLIDRLMLSGPECVAEELVDLLKRWLCDHILTYDQAFAAYLHERGQKVA
ncbi:Methyl-accepting chemotaxis protein [Paramagnetospirillum magnetotacticum MS-1]|uniref:Methyl-accepting chemotaxis protein n=2 Tax=Paramagnetospirillum magnetotacticum TaxID=188 RepID=A0A0C2YYI8_PARME|nr:Methyl-accepting chemotaxis protein [Paramagnetospirillum magnetotacticum MS-1]